MREVFAKSGKGSQLLRKIGIWGFLFFLVKGLIWLVVAIYGVVMLG